MSRSQGKWTRVRPKVAGLRHRAVPGDPEVENSPVLAGEPESESEVDSSPTGNDSARTTEEAQSAVAEPILDTRRLKYLSAAAGTLVILAVVSGIVAHFAGSDDRALTDTAANADLTNQVRDTVEKTFSYDPARPANTDNVAKQRLEGPAVQQHQQLFDQVRRLGPEQHVVLTTKVRSVGVISLQDDRARLLVFADQRAQRAGTDERNAGPAQVEIAAQKSGDRWKITGLTVL